MECYLVSKTAWSGRPLKLNNFLHMDDLCVNVSVCCTVHSENSATLDKCQPLGVWQKLAFKRDEQTSIDQHLAHQRKLGKI